MGFRAPKPTSMPSAALPQGARSNLRDPVAQRPPTTPQNPSMASAFSNPFSASFQYYRRNPGLTSFAPLGGRPPAARRGR